MKHIDVLGVQISSTSMDEVLKEIRKKVEKREKRPYFVATVNPEFVMLAHHDMEFANILNSVDVALPDGHGLRLAYPFAEIIPGRILVEALVKSNYRIFFLGGKPGIAETLASTYGGMGDSGEENIRSGEVDSARILSKIKKFSPDVLLVAYGAPWQEKWIAKHIDELHAAVAIGVGGTFDFLSGASVIPPQWVSTLGFEWLWRLVHEPWRWRRQVKLFSFLWLVVQRRMRSHL